MVEKEERGRWGTYGRFPGTDAALGFQGQNLGGGECIGERNGVRETDIFVWMDTRMDKNGCLLNVPGDRSQGVLRVGIS